MNKRTKDIVDKARALRGKPCAHLVEGGTPGNYCAAFVRYIFKSTLGRDGDFPVVKLPPYYQRKGIRNPPGKWFADSLAGDEIGRAVSIKNMQPGDILFYRDTCFGNWQRGSITHVALCIGNGGIMADARHTPGTVYVGHYTAMNGELIEVRRPNCLQTGSETPKEATITLKNGKAEAILYGSHVKKLEMDFDLDSSGLSVQIDKQPVKHKFVEAVFTPLKGLNISWNEHPGIGGGIRQVGIGSVGDGENYDPLKIISHDNRSRALYADSNIKQIRVRVLFENYALHIWVNGKETRTKKANILVA